MNDIENLTELLQRFADERDWSQFHSPKNLAMALTVEAAELLEQFQWLSESESTSLEKDKLERVKEEMADVFLYLLRMSDVLGVDLIAAANSKIIKNNEKYPADKVRGSSKKYNEY